MITIRSTRMQSLLNRAAKTALHLVPLAALSWLTLRWFPPHLSPFWPEAEVALILGGAGWLWLVVFNSGKLALPEAEVRFDNDCLQVQRFDETFTVRWEDLRGYRFTWELPPRLRIKRAEGAPIIIDLFMFSKSQRTILFEYLSAHRGAA